jgi:hypothetical protein
MPGLLAGASATESVGLPPSGDRTMPNIPTAADLRRWAFKCATDAAASTELAQRERLLKMRDALTALAENEEWLEGQKHNLESDAEILALAERIVRRANKTA